MYPLSKDKIKYERLIKILTLYRLTMVRPQQEKYWKCLVTVSEAQIEETIDTVKLGEKEVNY